MTADVNSAPSPILHAQMLDADLDVSQILDRFAGWTDKIHPTAGRGAIQERLELLVGEHGPDETRDRMPVFSGRSDVGSPLTPVYACVLLIRERERVWTHRPRTMRSRSR